MTELLQELQDAYDGKQPPENWKELFSAAFFELLRLKSECDILKPLLDQASVKLSKLSKPAFRVGEIVTAWTNISGIKSNAEYRVGSGEFVVGEVDSIDFRFGCYFYTVDCIANIPENFIRKVG